MTSLRVYYCKLENDTISTNSVSANKKNATLCHCKINISTIKIGHEVNKYRIMLARKVEKDISILL
jgi:hypothetical protein